MCIIIIIKKYRVVSSDLFIMPQKLNYNTAALQPADTHWSWSPKRRSIMAVHDRHIMFVIQPLLPHSFYSQEADNESQIKLLRVSCFNFFPSLNIVLFRANGVKLKFRRD